MKVLAKKLCSLKFFPFHVYDVYVLCMYECLYICLSVCGSTCMCVKVLMCMCGYSKPGADSKNLPGWLILSFEAGLSVKPRVSQLVLLSSLGLSPISPFRFCHSFQAWITCELHPSSGLCVGSGVQNSRFLTCVAIALTSKLSPQPKNYYS